MQAVAEKLTAKHGINLYEDETPYLRLDMPGFDRLTIERYWTKPTILTVGHYFEMNGDLVPDPQVDFYAKDGIWYPIAIDQFIIGYKRHVEINNVTGEMNLVVPLKLHDDLVGFTNMWAENIEGQEWLEWATRWQR